MVRRGIESRLRAGERVRFITLTEDPENPIENAKELQERWNRFKSAINRKTRKIGAYAVATELTRRGRPHLHCICSGGFIDRDRELVPRAVAAGFGRIADIREVVLQASSSEQKKDTADYVCKELAGYVSKSAGWAKQKKRHPVRTSRDWYEGGQAQAKKDLLAERLAESGEQPEEDEGAWWFITGTHSGVLKARGRNEAGEVVELRDLPDTEPKVRETADFALATNYPISPPPSVSDEEAILGSEDGGLNQGLLEPDRLAA